MTAAQRLSVFCRGDTAFAVQQIQQELRLYPTLNCLWLAASADTDQSIISQAQANQYLGQEVDVLVFDASQACRPDALAAALGTLRGGGQFFMLLPETTDSLWLQRFIHLAENFANASATAIFWQSPQPWPAMRWPQSRQPSDFSLTLDQQNALSAVHKVVSGHRRRPLLITADRGRGKSTLLGIAAAALASQDSAKIVVTAPSKQAIGSLLESFQRQLAGRPDNAASLQYIAPDELLKTLPAANLLLVDEAAALPQAILKKLLCQYPRIVFASTLHGYEGSGLGFKYQFAKLLDQQTPGWQQISLTTPVRWASEDPLEWFSYQALLMDAELTKQVQPPTGCDQLQLMQQTAAQIAQDESLLRQVFALLAAAHYRTRPSDVQALLDDNNRTLWLLRDNQHLYGVCWLNQEGPLENVLAKAVHQGRRRLKGDLLPQSLMTHAGDLQAANLHYQRIIRIAVRPECQRQGLGRIFLEKLFQALPAQTDVLGCSFALHEALFDFWLGNGFLPVRLGLHEDTVSAGRAVVMLKAGSDQGTAQIAALQQRLATQWPVLLPRYFVDLPAELVLVVSRSLPLAAIELSVDDLADIAGFTHHQRALEFSFVPLVKQVWQLLNTKAFAHCDKRQQALLIQVFLQQQALPSVCRQHQLNGHKALLETLREALRRLIAD